MGNWKQTSATVVAIAGLLSTGDAWSRQSILIGELSIGYDFQERNYKQEAAASNEGDTRNLFASPRVRFSSRDVSDLLELTYAPTFNYDDIEHRDFVGHDLSLLAEKNISREWLVRATDSYFKGEDTVSDYAGQQSAIIPGEVTPVPTAPGVSQPTESARQLSDRYGRRKYWRNDLGMNTDYTYAQDSVVGVGYNYGVLRNNNDDGYYGGSDYDRHEGIGRLSYRFNTQWQALTEVSYVRGLYDAPYSTDPLYSTDDDLTEYHGMVRVNYGWRPHDIFFGRYAYSETVYDDDARINSTIHDFTVGWDHDFSRRLRMTVSGGPSLVTFEEGDDETGWNGYAGLTWDFQHATLSAHTSYNYEFDNFDGLQTGLSKVWNSGMEYLYRFTPQLTTTLTANYERSDNDGASGAFVVNDSNGLNYREKTYDAGLSVRYTFLRNYTLAASYRYLDYSAPGDEYDEHRILVTLTASHELFRW